MFLLLRSIWVLPTTLVVHGVGVLLCLREPRIIDMWLARIGKCPRVRNHKIWRCNAYRP